MGFNRRKLEDQPREAAEKEAASSARSRQYFGSFSFIAGPNPLRPLAHSGF
jgi:hypothetical protein